MPLKYTTEIIIKKPRNEVVKLLDNPDNLKEWQPGFVSMKPMAGEHGKVGSKTKLNYKMGNRDVEMIETITERNLPDSLSFTFDAGPVLNIQHNRFEAVDEFTTKWVSENEFQFGNFGMKLMGWLMPGAFKKQSQLYLDKFKEFAEKN